MTPFYNPTLSYEENYQQGPFGLFASADKPVIPVTKPTSFLGYQVNTPFGIPAGPLLNANFARAAFAYGYDICVYKTVRTVEHKSHPLPNVLAIHPEGKLSAQLDTVLADNHYSQPLSITNSFGVPSYKPEIWQADMARAVQATGKGQILIGSFQGTQGLGSIEDDYALAARLVAETKAHALEANMSCPNEGAHHLLCFDFDKVERIVHAMKNAVPDLPLLIKLAYFSDEQSLTNLLKKIGHLVDGFSTINTLSARPVNAQGQPALSANRPEGGVCGDAIRWAGLDMVQRLASLRARMELKFAIVGVGGVNQPQHFKQYLSAGADAVMSATGAMWHPNLALEIKQNYPTGAL
ncbi:tRNA-dihydrouridine synthase [Zophobihabitans entericus]|uniref:Dihydroorotate oxidase n=1 Tax=Zophobihabitans entericus TaxID=1635327 RepID=A0A6G9IE28_9GAMM|nr:tRNA-dihydrouridine synthase [Zophobihabitans entericus]QIQ22072.1 dihydroorotate oxidase [Zophobihabitans entericus]